MHHAPSFKPEANLRMTHSDILWCDLTPMARGSSALVYKALVRLYPGQEPETVVLKERLQQTDPIADERVRPAVPRPWWLQGRRVCKD